MKKLATLLFSFLLVFVDLKVAEHYHEGYKFHQDCELCIIQHQPQHKKDVKLQLRIEGPVLKNTGGEHYEKSCAFAIYL